MRQFTTPEQTAKLIELGFEKPKNERWVVDVANESTPSIQNIVKCQDYSIGELLSFLPQIIPQGYGYYINITHDSVSWVIDYQQHGDTQYKYIVSDVELIDAAFAMVVKLKEEGVI